MAAIGKGDWVESLSDWEDDDFGVAVTRGTAYYVEAIGEADALEECERCGVTGGIVLVLTGASTPGGGWCPCGFKPLGGNAQERTAPPIRVTEDA